MGDIWAHSANISGRRHLLRDHLLSTSALTADFAASFGARAAGAAVGALHDAGKISVEWQEYLARAEAASLRDQLRPTRVNHKSAGARLVSPRAGLPGQLACYGHHGGLPDKSDDRLLGFDARTVSDSLVALVPEVIQFLDGPMELPEAWRQAARNKDFGAIEFGTRMLHSALVDADFLDTAAHFTDTPITHARAADFADLAARFEARRADAVGRRVASPTDAARQAVYEAAIEAARGTPGIYRLPAPTGSGKTFASAGFALHHAARNGHRRVVMAVPFLSITEQNAAVYGAMLGDDVVLEHHSAVEPEGLQRYGVENWDSPFIITTTVQLFESLFSGKPSKSRKLHRLVGSVIVLDEVQAIPPHALSTVLDGLRILVQHFGATVLLASATQPPFEVLEPLRRHGVDITSVVPDSTALYRSMRRVTTEWVEVTTPQAIAQTVASESQALLVVNTTAQARDLARLLRDRVDHEVLHLSTRMCQAHRRAVLMKVTRLLSEGTPVTLVSTQLIEAGVDVDFPVVFRAAAPADSLLQAAGRANREGHRASGRLVVLHGDAVSTIRAYATGIAKTTAHFLTGGGELDNPEHMCDYFRDLYTAANPDHEMMAKNLAKLRSTLAFNAVGEEFRMIDDDSISVLVRYDETASAAIDGLIDTIEQGTTPARVDLRALQPFVVSVPSSLARNSDVAAYLDEPTPGVRLWTGPYDSLVGVDTDAGPHDTVW